MRQIGAMIQSTKIKIGILMGAIALTVAIHYGFILEHLFGHSEWVHALHSRFCYLPIMIAAAWFGLRGGLISATIISVSIMPYLFDTVVTNPNHVTSLSQELIEIFFYYTIGILVGVLVDREMRIRRRHESTQLELERSHRLSLVGQMAASVAHEIKNPLASIKGAVEILSEDATQRQDREEFKQIVVNEIKRIDGTVKEFLEFARPKETTLARQDLSAGLQASLRQLERQISDSGMVLTSKIEPGVIIQGDQEKIHQVVLNLVLNAIEASDRGSAIEVTLQSDLSQGIRLSVRDHGRGIPPEEIEKIFEPFYSTKTTGTGLGLAIVKSIVEAHGGQIRVTVCDGGGTEVRLLLPLLAAHEETAWR